MNCWMKFGNLLCCTFTDGKSYAAAQAALKTNEEQFFTQEEIKQDASGAFEKKMSKWGMNTLSLYVQRNEEVISA